MTLREEALVLAETLDNAEQRCAAGNTQTWVEIDRRTWYDVRRVLRALATEEKNDA